MVVDVGEALFIKGSSASISSPPKGADSTGLLQYKSIVAAMPSTTLTKLQKTKGEERSCILPKLKNRFSKAKHNQTRKTRNFFPLQRRIKEVLNTQPLLLQEPPKTTSRDQK